MLLLWQEIIQSQVYGLLDWDLVTTGTETTAVVVGIFHLSQSVQSAVHDKQLQKVSVRKIYRMGQEKLYEPYSLQWEGKDGERVEKNMLILIT